MMDVASRFKKSFFMVEPTPTFYLASTEKNRFGIGKPPSGAETDIQQVVTYALRHPEELTLDHWTQLHQHIKKNKGVSKESNSSVLKNMKQKTERVRSFEKSITKTTAFKALSEDKQKHVWTFIKSCGPPAEEGNNDDAAVKYIDVGSRTFSIARPAWEPRARHWYEKFLGIFKFVVQKLVSDKPDLPGLINKNQRDLKALLQTESRVDRIRKSLEVQLEKTQELHTQLVAQLYGVMLRGSIDTQNPVVSIQLLMAQYARGPNDFRFWLETFNTKLTDADINAIQGLVAQVLTGEQELQKIKRIQAFIDQKTTITEGERSTLQGMAPESRPYKPSEHPQIQVFEIITNSFFEKSRIDEFVSFTELEQKELSLSPGEQDLIPIFALKRAKGEHLSIITTENDVKLAVNPDLVQSITTPPLLHSNSTLEEVKAVTELLKKVISDRCCVQISTKWQGDFADLVIDAIKAYENSLGNAQERLETVAEINKMLSGQKAIQVADNGQTIQFQSIELTKLALECSVKNVQYLASLFPKIEGELLAKKKQELSSLINEIKKRQQFSDNPPVLEDLNIDQLKTDELAPAFQKIEMYKQSLEDAISDTTLRYSSKITIMKNGFPNIPLSTLEEYGQLERNKILSWEDETTGRISAIKELNNLKQEIEQVPSQFVIDEKQALQEAANKRETDLKTSGNLGADVDLSSIGKKLDELRKDAQTRKQEAESLTVSYQRLVEKTTSLNQGADVVGLKHFDLEIPQINNSKSLAKEAVALQKHENNVEEFQKRIEKKEELRQKFETVSPIINRELRAVVDSRIQNTQTLEDIERELRALDELEGKVKKEFHGRRENLVTNLTQMRETLKNLQTAAEGDLKNSINKLVEKIEKELQKEVTTQDQLEQLETYRTQTQESIEARKIEVQQQLEKERLKQNNLLENLQGRARNVGETIDLQKLSLPQDILKAKEALTAHREAIASADTSLSVKIQNREKAVQAAVEKLKQQGKQVNIGSLDLLAKEKAVRQLQEEIAVRERVRQEYEQIKKLFNVDQIPDSDWSQVDVMTTERMNALSEKWNLKNLRQQSSRIEGKRETYLKELEKNIKSAEEIAETVKDADFAKPVREFIDEMKRLSDSAINWRPVSWSEIFDQKLARFDPSELSSELSDLKKNVNRQIVAACEKERVGLTHHIEYAKRIASESNDIQANCLALSITKLIKTLQTIAVQEKDLRKWTAIRALTTTLPDDLKTASEQLSVACRETQQNFAGIEYFVQNILSHPGKGWKKSKEYMDLKRTSEALSHPTPSSTQSVLELANKLRSLLSTAKAALNAWSTGLNAVGEDLEKIAFPSHLTGLSKEFQPKADAVNKEIELLKKSTATLSKEIQQGKLSVEEAQGEKNKYTAENDRLHKKIELLKQQEQVFNRIKNLQQLFDRKSFGSEVFVPTDTLFEEATKQIQLETPDIDAITARIDKELNDLLNRMDDDIKDITLKCNETISRWTQVQKNPPELSFELPLLQKLPIEQAIQLRSNIKAERAQKLSELESSLQTREQLFYRAHVALSGSRGAMLLSREQDEDLKRILSGKSNEELAVCKKKADHFVKERDKWFESIAGARRQVGMLRAQVQKLSDKKNFVKSLHAVEQNLTASETTLQERISEDIETLAFLDDPRTVLPDVKEQLNVIGQEIEKAQQFESRKQDLTNELGLVTELYQFLSDPAATKSAVDALRKLTPQTLEEVESLYQRAQKMYQDTLQQAQREAEQLRTNAAQLASTAESLQNKLWRLPQDKTFNELPSNLKKLSEKKEHWKTEDRQQIYELEYKTLNLQRKIIEEDWKDMIFEFSDVKNITRKLAMKVAEQYHCDDKVKREKDIILFFTQVDKLEYVKDSWGVSRLENLIRKLDDQQRLARAPGSRVYLRADHGKYLEELRHTLASLRNPETKVQSLDAKAMFEDATRQFRTAMEFARRIDYLTKPLGAKQGSIFTEDKFPWETLKW